MIQFLVNLSRTTYSIVGTAFPTDFRKLSLRDLPFAWKAGEPFENRDRKFNLFGLDLQCDGDSTPQNDWSTGDFAKLL